MPKQITLEEILKEFDKRWSFNGEFQNKPILGNVRNFITTYFTQLAESLRPIGKPEMPPEEIMLLDRHEREDYNENIVGFNKAVDELNSKINKALGKE